MSKRKKLHIHIFKLMLENARQAKIIRKLKQENAELAGTMALEMTSTFMAPESEKPKRH